jgi:D-glycerate 3-kinase
MAGARKEWIARICAEEGLPDSYAANVVDYLRVLADHILESRREQSRPVTVGINGGQGSGKSTLSLFLVEWLIRECGLSALCLSLDDLYYSKAKRLELARSIHPLFATRGVPGTHDVALGMRLLDKQLGIRDGETLAMPKFDKAADDLLAEAEWPVVAIPVDVVVFEGWCIGARPQSDAALETPINDLEAKEDRDGRWRFAVNEHLKTDYGELFKRLDRLVMLRIPSFEKAIAWRQLQESKLGDQLNRKQLMRFMMHFERLTRHMLESVPTYADAVIDIDDQHNFRGQKGLSV